MLDFAVQVKGEAQGRWVLAVDSVHDKLLVTRDDNSLRWVLTSDCKLLKARNPELPIPVVMVKEQKEHIVLPHLGLNAHGNGRN